MKLVRTDPWGRSHTGIPSHFPPFPSDAILLEESGSLPDSKEGLEICFSTAKGLEFLDETHSLNGHFRKNNVSKDRDCSDAQSYSRHSWMSGVQRF